MCARKVAITTFCLLVATSAGINIQNVYTNDVDISDSNDGTYRLPNDTHPESYHLSIITRIDLDILDFSGIVIITILVDRPTQQIVLHAKQLTITNVTLTDSDTMSFIKLLPHAYDEAKEFLQIFTDDVILRAGNRLILEIGYNGTLRTDIGGFFKSSYLNFDGSIIWLAATKFEPTDARHAFPCYDEPSFKANFSLHITHGKRYNAISNMPEERVENADDTATTSFVETPPISTYTIAFVVSDFPYRTNTNNPNVFRHRVYARPSGVALTKLGMQEGERLLHALEKYLLVNSTLPKMDQIAIPGFETEATENWGLVTYREANILFDVTIHNFTRQLDVIRTISLATSHQWFGNLITHRFWQFLWITEGFADLFQHIGIDMVYPEWNIFQYYVTNTVQRTLKQDAALNTRSMTHYVERSDDIKSEFDYVTYGKSGSVIRMFFHAFTEHSFKKGLRYFFENFSFSSASEDDLFAALDRAVKEDGNLPNDKNVRTIFSSWSNQAGYPFVLVERDYEKNTINLKQEIYLSDSVNATGTTTWWIPFNCATATQPNFNNTIADGWMSAADKSISLPGPLASNDWVLFNKQQSSFYRVQYDERNYELLAKQLNSDNFTTIHVLSRSQHLDDLLEFVNAGRVKVIALLDVLTYLHRETEYAPWVPAQNAISMLNRRLSGSKYHQRFRSIVANATGRFFDGVGLEDVAAESILKKYSRVIATNLACEYGVDSCLNTTNSKLVAYLANIDDDDNESSGLPVNTTSIILSNGVRIASPLHIEMLWKQFIDVDDADERALMADSFGRIGSISLLKKYLSKTLENYPENLNGSEWRLILFRSAAKNSIDGLRLSIQLLWNHAPRVIEMYKLNDLNDIVLELSELVGHPIIRKEFHHMLIRLEWLKYIETLTVKSAERLVEGNREWLLERQQDLDEWFGFHNFDDSAGDGHSSAQLVGPSQLLLPSMMIIVTLLYNE